MKIFAIVLISLIVISLMLIIVVGDARTDEKHEVYLPLMGNCDPLTWAGMCGLKCRNYDIFNGKLVCVE